MRKLHEDRDARRAARIRRRAEKNAAAAPAADIRHEVDGAAFIPPPLVIGEPAFVAPDSPEAAASVCDDAGPAQAAGTVTRAASEAVGALRQQIAEAIKQVDDLRRARHIADGGNADAAADVRVGADEEIARKRELIRLLTARWASLVPSLLAERRAEALANADCAAKKAQDIADEIEVLSARLNDLQAERGSAYLDADREQGRAAELADRAGERVRLLRGTISEVERGGNDLDCCVNRLELREVIEQWKRGFNYAGTVYYPAQVVLAYFTDDGTIAAKYVVSLVDAQGRPAGCPKPIRDCVCPPAIATLLRDRPRDLGKQLLADRDLGRPRSA